MTKKIGFYHCITFLLLLWFTNLFALSHSIGLICSNFFVCGLVFIYLNPTKISYRYQIVLVLYLILTTVLLRYFISPYWGGWLFLLLIVLSVIPYIKQVSILTSGFFILCGAGFFNLSFISQTQITDVQYDFASCYNYIEYIMENNLLFWNENPIITRPSYSTYHPILHFFMAALAIRSGELIGFSKSISNEATQVIFCFYMFWYGLICIRILNFFNFSRITFCSLIAFIVFFPIYQAISGYFNNDCLLLPLQAGTLYYALCYYHDDGRKNLFLIWLFATLAALTKLSGIIVLPAVVFLLAIKLYKKRNKYILRDLIIFAVFLLLGLSIWPCYQHFVFHLPPNFVPPQTNLSLENYTIWQRFSPWKGFFYDDLFYHDFGINIWETLTKTALFGQWDIAQRATIILPLVRFFVSLFKIILFTILIAVFYLIYKQKKSVMTWFCLILLSSLIGGIVSLSLMHPYMCNQDFRYIAILPLAWSLILGLFMEKMPVKIRWGIAGILNCFAFLAVFIWHWVSF